MARLSLLFLLSACGGPQSAIAADAGAAAADLAPAADLVVAAQDAATAVDAALPVDAARALDAAIASDAAIAGDEFAYIVTLFGGIFAFKLEQDGTPTPLPHSPVNPGISFYSGALHPPFLYAAAQDNMGGHVYAYRIAADGTLAPIMNVANPGDPYSLAVDALGRFVFVGNFSGQSISVYRIAADGSLETLSTSDPADAGLGETPAFLASHPSGRFLYETGPSGIRGFSVGDSGTLTELHGSPFGATLVRGGAISFIAGGRFLLAGGAPNPSSETGLSSFSVDDQSGELIAVAGSPFADVGSSDANAIHLAVGGGLVYAVKTQTGTLTALSIDADGGVLTPVIAPFDAGTFPYSVAASSRFVLVGNDDVGHFSVFALDGGMNPIAGSPFPMNGLQPQILITR